MTYIRIPVNLQSPTDHVSSSSALSWSSLKEVPVRVHCIASYRVSAFFYRYSSRCARHGRGPSAGAEMETIWHPEGIWAAFVTA